jgi:hypothetical protein
MYKRKTRDVYEVQADYGYGHGFEVVTREDTRKAARERLREYRKNDTAARSLRLVTRRERIEA